jgi:glycosyltransferase involved in cell wall biosynthesis
MEKRYGGVPTHIVALSQNLLSKGYKVYLACPYGYYVDRIKSIGVEHYEMNFSVVYPLTYGKGGTSSRKRFDQFVATIKPDIIHCHGIRNIPYCIYSSFRAPFVWTCHIDVFGYGNKIKEAFYNTYLRLLFKVTHFPIIAVSQDIHSWLIKKYAIYDKRIYVIQNGIKPDEFMPLKDDEKEETRKLYAINNDDFVICICASVAPVKGHDILLKAVNIVQNSRPEWKIKILFAGHLLDENKVWFEGLREYALKNSIDMNYIGYSDTRKILGISNICVQPSYQ